MPDNNRLNSMPRYASHRRTVRYRRMISRLQHVGLFYLSIIYKHCMVFIA